MAIPETQLETWSHQGSVTQSKNTYATIRKALESPAAKYSSRSYGIFLQGSYCNDTNIYAESDVDIVICLDSVWYHDLDALTDAQRASFNSTYSDGSYTHADFKKDVLTRLTTEYGSDIDPSGTKAIRIKPNSGRRKADVLPAVERRRYYSFTDASTARFDVGIQFFLPDGTKVVNFPKQHSDNCTTKHQASSGHFKPMVRILKNMRGRAIQNGLLAEGDAPSYFIEGLLYNVPTPHFGSNYGNTFVNSINWILGADKTKFECANGRYYLVRDGSKVCWPTASCDKFLSALSSLWKNW